MLPILLDALHMFGCPTVCLDAAKCMVASKGMRDIQTYGGVQVLCKAIAVLDSFHLYV